MFKNISVIGSGLNGFAIAAHFANVRYEVILLDLVRRGYIWIRKRFYLQTNKIEFNLRMIRTHTWNR